MPIIHNKRSDWFQSIKIQSRYLICPEFPFTFLDSSQLFVISNCVIYLQPPVIISKTANEKQFFWEREKTLWTDLCVQLRVMHHNLNWRTIISNNIFTWWTYEERQQLIYMCLLSSLIRFQVRTSLFPQTQINFQEFSSRLIVKVNLV